MKKHYLWIAALAMGLYACSDDTITPGGDDITSEEPTQETVSPQTIKQAKLTSFSADPNRISFEPKSRTALDGSLDLYAKIENLSKDGSISGFVKEENGRYLSATCVYYNPDTKEYYVTYHMQGNNYNTDQTDEVSGFIETFTLDANGNPTTGKVIMSANPNEEDFDFNHLFFDKLSADNYYRGNDKEDRLIAVGHVWTPGQGKGNTQAIIGNIDLEELTIDYSVVYTNDKILDSEGKSLGTVDAADVNSVIRIYDWYVLATRKGLAMLGAKEDELFEPLYDKEGNRYFIKTPGSAKFVYNNPGQYSYFSALYLTNPTPEGGLSYSSSSPAKMANFFVHGGFGEIGAQSGDIDIIDDFVNFNILEYRDQVDLPVEISPMDGKNAFTILDSQYYYSLGKGGLFADNNYASSWKTDVVKFGDYDKDDYEGRPVNCVFVDGAGDNTGGEAHNGYIYVANGRCLTILDRATLEVVAEYSADIEENASANYIYVYNGEKNQTEKRTERIITVAYGQAGVKIFKFIPPTKW